MPGNDPQETWLMKVQNLHERFKGHMDAFLDTKDPKHKKAAKAVLAEAKDQGLLDYVQELDNGTYFGFLKGFK